jgi:hypothetical protein
MMFVYPMMFTSVMYIYVYIYIYVTVYVYQMHKNYDVYVNMTFFSSAASGVPLERSWDTNSNTSEHMFVQILCMCTYIYILHYILLHIYKLLIYI